MEESNERQAEEFDAIVVGGGIAGSATAAALAAKGLRVLICEAGLANERRLAGEFMHPPAARDLDELGLLKPLLEAGAVPNYGLAVISDGNRLEALLSYSEVPGGRPTGIAMEHTKLASRLLETVASQPNITVWNESRVGSADFSGRLPVAMIKRRGETVSIAAPLIVSAEGRGSSIRQEAGIEVQKDEAFCMVGWKVPDGRLPYPGYGHIFTGARTATLAYQVSPREVRIMFELEAGEDLNVEHLLPALPRPFRDDVEKAIENEPRLMTRVFGLTIDRAASGRLAIVGDAGGCVHPLTASGISWCTRDALRLASEVGPRFKGGDGVVDALVGYERERRGPMRTRVALGPVLADALCAQDPGTRLIREGLFRYWRRSPRGRAVSIGLLSTERASAAALAREYAAVSLHALTGIRRGILRPGELPSALASLLQRNKELIRRAMPRHNSHRGQS